MDLRKLKDLRRRSHREQQKKAIGLDWQNLKTTTLQMHHAFLNTARLRRENGQFPVLLEEANTRQRTELRYSLLKFNSRKKWQHLTNWTRKQHEFIFWVTFSSSSPAFWLELRLKILRRRRQRKRQKSNRKVSRSWNNRDITFSSDVAGAFHRRRRPGIFKVMLHEAIRNDDF